MSDFKNEVLATLPPAEIRLLQQHLTRVRLISGQILHEPGEHLSDVFFIEHGLASVMAITDDRQDRLEVALIGRDSMVGLQVLFGPQAQAFNSVMVQVAGEAYRLPAHALLEVMRHAPVLSVELFHALELLFAQVSQSAACNSQHVLSQRLARWLLIARDRASKDDLPLTQEFLAIMLGVQRPRVTIAVDLLNKAGLIRIGRGHVMILDRAGLENAACSCYTRLRNFGENVAARHVKAERL